MKGLDSVWWILLLIILVLLKVFRVFGGFIGFYRVSSVFFLVLRTSGDFWPFLALLR